ncbi:MAG: biopolymer transporter ExbD [Xanthomonadales bacterium]|nr:biopolymer transporter ExbD [Xanthomonadales bacterium]
MNFLPLQAEDEIEFNLVPLIDIILTLLIFFMVTTTFEQRALLRVDLPEAGGVASAESAQALTVVIDENGRYYLNEREVMGVDPVTLAAALNEVADGDPDQRIVVRAAARASHQAVVTALDVLGRHGFSRIEIATVPAGDGG